MREIKTYGRQTAANVLARVDGWLVGWMDSWSCGVCWNWDWDMGNRLLNRFSLSLSVFLSLSLSFSISLDFTLLLQFSCNKRRGQAVDPPKALGVDCADRDSRYEV